MRKKRIKNVNLNIVQQMFNYEKKGVSYIDSLVELHTILKIDMEDLVEMLPDNILNEIKIEFAKKNMVKNEKLNNTVNLRTSTNNIMNWIKG